MHPIRYLLPALLALQLTACAALRQDLESPKVRLVALEVIEATLLEQRYAITLRVQNPNDIALPVKGLTYKLRLAGEDFADGLTPKKFSIPAYGESLVGVEMTTNLLGSLRHLADWLSGEKSELDYEIAGKLDVDLPLIGRIPFSSSGSVNLNETFGGRS